MSDEGKAQEQPQTASQFDVAKAPITYPDHDVPIFAADMVTIIANQGGTIKLNFLRLDNDVFGRTSTPRPTQVAHVVMPVVSLINLIAIAEIQLKSLGDLNVISQGHMKKIREIVEKAVATQPVVAPQNANPQA